jgi:hypothetical protein
MIRSTVDWLVRNSAASPWVGLVRTWITTSSSRAGGGVLQGRPVRGGSRCWVRGVV